MDQHDMIALVERHLKAEGAGDIDGAVAVVHRRHRARRRRVPRLTAHRQGRRPRVLRLPHGQLPHRGRATTASLLLRRLDDPRTVDDRNRDRRDARHPRQRPPGHVPRSSTCSTSATASSVESRSGSTAPPSSPSSRRAESHTLTGGGALLFGHLGGTADRVIPSRAGLPVVLHDRGWHCPMRRAVKRFTSNGRDRA